MSELSAQEDPAPTHKSSIHRHGEDLDSWSIDLNKWERQLAKDSNALEARDSANISPDALHGSETAAASTANRTRIRRRFARDLDQPPSYAPLVLKRVSKTAKRTTKTVTQLACVDPSKDIETDTALGRFKESTAKVQLLVCITIYNEPFT